MVARYLERDRDLALRRSLAAGHLAQAQAAYARVLAGQDPKGDERRTALREAGHALALAPQERAAVELITGLIGHPPANVPAEVDAALRQQNFEADAAAARRSVRVYASMMLFLLFLPLIEVRNWIAATAAGVPLLAALLSAVLRARRSQSSWRWVPAPFFVLCSIAATSAIGGPYVIMPGLLIAFATATMAVVPYLHQRPLLWGGACIATAVVPVVLEGLGLLPVEVTMQTSRLVIDMQFADVSPLVMRAALIAFVLLPLIAGLVFAHRSAERMQAMRQRLTLHLWHLRQLAPSTDP